MKTVATRYEDSLLYALLYNRQFSEVITELKTLPSNPTRDAMAIAGSRCFPRGAPLQSSALILLQATTNRSLLRSVSLVCN